MLNFHKTYIKIKIKEPNRETIFKKKTSFVEKIRKNQKCTSLNDLKPIYV